jgi:hypothetical protein
MLGSSSGFVLKTVTKTSTTGRGSTALRSRLGRYSLLPGWLAAFLDGMAIGETIAWKFLTERRDMFSDTKSTLTFLKGGFALSLLWLSVVDNVSIALAQSVGMFVDAGNTITTRRGHTATLLADGRVLIAGGWGVPENQGTSLASAEVYDPSTGKFTATGNMTTPRGHHTATLLPDGRVLIAGGTSSGNNALPSVELYDPSTGTFSPTGDMIAARNVFGTSSLLPNGKVLMIASGVLPQDPAGAELYDPATDTFSATGDMPAGLGDGILLPNGKVFLFGLRTSELYDPDTGTFSLAAGLFTLTYNLWPDSQISPDTQTLLLNGKVFFSGSDGDNWGAFDGTYLYDPSTGTFIRAGNMHTARELHTATLLPDGTVLMAGGVGLPPQPGGPIIVFTPPILLSSAELYDPVTATFTPTGDMTLPRCCHTATLLNDGRVLIVGGASAEIYTPPVLVPSPALFSVSGDGQGQGAILHAGTDQIASPDNPAVVGEALEIYLTGLADGSVIPPQVAIGGRMAEILFFGKAPGFADQNQVNVRVPDGIDPGDAVPVRLTYLGRPSNEVTIGVR